MKITFTVVLLLISGFAISGCANTVRGAGKDIANTVEAVGDSVRRVAN